MALHSDMLMLATPQRESEDVVRVRWTGKEEGNEEMTDFGEGQGEERLRLSLKEVREEGVEVDGFLFWWWSGSK